MLRVAKSKLIIGRNVKINYVKDRPGHDIRYALESKKIKNKLKWKPKISFNEGLAKTFDWYMENQKYYSSLNKKDIVTRLGKEWLKKELF